MSLEILPTEEKIFCTHKNRVKRGFRYNNSGKRQKFMCKDCGHKFIEGNDLRFKADEKTVISAVKLSQKLSTRNIADYLKKEHNVVVSHVAVYKWIKKYPRLVLDPYALCKEQGIDYFKVRSITLLLVDRGYVDEYILQIPHKEAEKYMGFVSNNFDILCDKMRLYAPGNIEFGEDHKRETYFLRIK